MTYTVRTSAGPAVLTEGLGRRFGETHALRELDLAVEPGTVLGLLGHNGAGKTTAVRILTTLLAPSEGRAFVAGHDVAAAPGAVREQVSLAGQQASLDERLTGRENLMLLGRLQRISKADAAARTGELLERFGIAHAADRQVGTYSGGMRRRLDLAACLVVPRPVVFLDEPTTGLDPASRQDMWGAVEGLVADGVALVLTTQYLEEADRLADQIVVLAEGRTVAAGTPGGAEGARGRSARAPHAAGRRCAPGGGAAVRAARPRARCARAARDRRRPRRPARSARGARHARGRRRRGRGGRAQPADARRRVLRPHRPARNRAGGRMTATLQTFNEIRLLAGRSLRHIPRIPEKAFGAVMLPLVFVLLFAYVFGSAIAIPGGDYHAYLVSGIFAQSMIGTVPGIAVGMASDIRSGLIDRLRTLPISRTSVVAGRTIAELVELIAGMVVVAICGLAVGWAPHGTVLETLGAFGLLLLFAFAVTWAGMFLGLVVRDPDGADGIAMTFIFPAMFLSGIFVPVAGLPSPLRQIAEINPLTALATAVRELFGVATGPLPDVWTLQHPVATSLLWAAAIMAVFIPLAVRRYQRMGR